MKRVNKKNDPLYLSLKEVCKLLEVKPHTLDYWEKRLPEVKPSRIGKRKFYKKEDLEVLFQIKRLLEEGYSIEGVRKKIRSLEKNLKESQKKERAGPTLFPDLVFPSATAPPRAPQERMDKSENLKRLLHEVLAELKELYKIL